MSHSVPACPHCMTQTEQPLICDRCGWRWHANPKPAAAVLLERRTGAEDEPSILLLRRAVEPGHGAWDLPAGFLDPGESFEMAARRETLEEAGIEVELLSLAGVYHSPDANAVAAVFRARAIDPSVPVQLDFESSEHAWVRRSRVAEWLPKIAFSSMASAVADWAAELSRQQPSEERSGNWIAGEPEGTIWSPIKLKGKRTSEPILTFRCSACGYLESYAGSK